MRARRALLQALLVLPVAARGGEHAVLTVVGDSAPPFRIFNAGEAPSGLYFDLLRTVAARAGVRLRFEQAPPARALAMMRSGEADLMIGLLMKDDRATYMAFLQPALPPVEKAFFVMPGGVRIDRYEDLAGLRIGVERGKGYSPRFDADTALDKEVSDDYETAVRKLVAGRVDAVLMPEPEGAWTLRNLGVAAQVAPFRIPGTPAYVTLSRRSRHLARQRGLERSLAAVLAAGMYDVLAARYR